jgi:hypothetical protein
MANMSASILRNIVSSTFKYPANKIILSGYISPEWIGKSSTNVAYKDVRDDVEYLWSWNSIDGFKPVDNCYNCSHYYNSNHNVTVTDGRPLHECVDSTEVFFVLVHKLDDYIDYISVFKAPNFAQKWAEIEAEDVQRWENWISNV